MEVGISSTVQFIISLLGFFGNLVLIISIWRVKKLHTSGYLLMAFLASTELFCGLIGMSFGYMSIYWYVIEMRLTLISGYWTSREIYGCCFTTCQPSPTFLISYNRFYSVVYYQNYSTKFTLKHTGVMIAAVIGVSCVSTFPFLPGKLQLARFVYVPQLYKLIPDLEATPKGMSILITIQAIASILVIVMITFYAVTLRKLRKIRKVCANASTNNTGSNNNEGPTREDVILTLQFSLVTLVFVIALLVVTVNNFLAPLITDVGVTKWMALFQTWLWQFNFSINPLLYALVNKRLRRIMKATVSCQRGQIMAGSVTNKSHKLASGPGVEMSQKPATTYIRVGTAGERDSRVGTAVERDSSVGTAGEIRVSFMQK